MNSLPADDTPEPLPVRGRGGSRGEGVGWEGKVEQKCPEVGAVAERVEGGILARRGEVRRFAEEAGIAGAEEVRDGPGGEPLAFGGTRSRVAPRFVARGRRGEGL